MKPGEAVDIEVQTEGPARVGLVAVDKSVFILAENRLNLRQVFDELERLYLEPRVELHEAWALNSITTRGASETFEDAGLVVMTNMDVPDGEEHIERRPQPAGAVQAVAAEAAPRDSPGRFWRYGAAGAGRGPTSAPVLPRDVAMDRSDHR